MTAATFAALHLATRGATRMMACRWAARMRSRIGQGGLAMLNATSCNAVLAVLIVLAALGPAIIDVARLAKCAIVPCRGKERI
jgi:hypothetical protein